MQYGKSPFLECSSRGDKRFSAFYAIVNGKSIEEQYQAAKIFEDDSTGLNWKDAKGRRAVNAVECAILYENLWRQYISEHPELLGVLKESIWLERYICHERLCEPSPGSMEDTQRTNDKFVG